MLSPRVIINLLLYCLILVLLSRICFLILVHFHYRYVDLNLRFLYPNDYQSNLFLPLLSHYRDLFNLRYDFICYQFMIECFRIFIHFCLMVLNTLFHTNVYRLAFASTFVPSIKWPDHL